MDFREQIRWMERININDMDRVPEWARAEKNGKNRTAEGVVEISKNPQIRRRGTK